jgi:hypothetical protein
MRKENRLPRQERIAVPEDKVELAMSSAGSCNKQSGWPRQMRGLQLRMGRGTQSGIGNNECGDLLQRFEHSPRCLIGAILIIA